MAGGFEIVEIKKDELGKQETKETDFFLSSFATARCISLFPFPSIPLFLIRLSLPSSFIFLKKGRAFSLCLGTEQKRRAVMVELNS